MFVISLIETGEKPGFLNHYFLKNMFCSQHKSLFKYYGRYIYQDMNDCQINY